MPFFFKKIKFYGHVIAYKKLVNRNDFIVDIGENVSFSFSVRHDVVFSIPREESGQFRFLRVVCLPNLKGSVGLILSKASVMRISIPIDLSSPTFIPLSCFIRSRRPTPLLALYLVFFPPRSTQVKGFMVFSNHHSFIVTLFTLDFHSCLFRCK